VHRIVKRLDFHDASALASPSSAFMNCSTIR
jgi:hypothetical protein